MKVSSGITGIYPKKIMGHSPSVSNEVLADH